MSVADAVAGVRQSSVPNALLSQVERRDEHAGAQKVHAERRGAVERACAGSIEHSGQADLARSDDPRVLQPRAAFDCDRLRGKAHEPPNPGGLDKRRVRAREIQCVRVDPNRLAIGIPKRWLWRRRKTSRHQRWVAAAVAWAGCTNRAGAGRRVGRTGTGEQKCSPVSIYRTPAPALIRPGG